MQSTNDAYLALMMNEVSISFLSFFSAQSLCDNNWNKNTELLLWARDLTHTRKFLGLFVIFFFFLLLQITMSRPQQFIREQVLVAKIVSIVWTQGDFLFLKKYTLCFELSDVCLYGIFKYAFLNEQKLRMSWNSLILPRI